MRTVQNLSTSLFTLKNSEQFKKIASKENFKLYDIFAETWQFSLANLSLRVSDFVETTIKKKYFRTKWLIWLENKIIKNVPLFQARQRWRMSTSPTLTPSGLTCRYSQDSSTFSSRSPATSFSSFIPSFIPAFSQTRPVGPVIPAWSPGSVKSGESR